VDVRVIAATNKNLGELAPQGRFREDLYYRLSAMTIHVPPLRERPEEIPWLSQLFLVEFAAQYGRDAPALSPSTLERFARHRWPGNVRELQNAIMRIVVLGSDGFALNASGPPEYDDAPAGPAASEAIPSLPSAARAAVPDDGLGLREIGDRAAAGAEAGALLRVLELVRWNRLEAARRLRVSYNTLLVKMKRHGLD
jgi:two-component system, NtrC family, response regulator HydG